MDIEGVDGTLLSDTLWSIGFAESAVARTKSMDLCVSEIKDHEQGVGAGMNTTLLSLLSDTL